MNQEQLADLVIDRLNEIAKHDPEAIAKLIGQRVPCNDELADHPTVQVHQELGMTRVGMLGILNGIVGAIDKEGDLKGYGYIAAVYDDNGTFLRFRRTDDPEVKFPKSP